MAQKSPRCGIFENVLNIKSKVNGEKSALEIVTGKLESQGYTVFVQELDMAIFLPVNRRRLAREEALHKSP